MNTGRGCTKSTETGRRGRGVQLHETSTNTTTASISGAEMAPKMRKVKQDVLNYLLNEITNPFGF
jgi:hypothetical protein